MGVDLRGEATRGRKAGRAIPGEKPPTEAERSDVAKKHVESNILIVQKSVCL